MIISLVASTVMSHYRLCLPRLVLRLLFTMDLGLCINLLLLLLKDRKGIQRPKSVTILLL